MAITDIAAYAHLSDADIEALGFELDAIRCDIEESLGENDAAYIRRTITFQRTLDVVARLIIGCSRSRAGWILGTASLAVAKSVENMEIGHNVSHGQWDWMNDPEIHSSTWEFDMVALSSQWKYAHTYRHHVFSDVLGMDDYLGFGVMRVPATSGGDHSICCSRSRTCSWRSHSNGASPCTTSIWNGLAQRRPPKSPLRQGR